MKINFKNSIMLFLAAVIWGCAFVAQSVGMDYMGPYTFNGFRSILGTIVLIPVVILMNKFKSPEKKALEDKKTTIIGGICCGLALCLATNLQQIGMQYTSPGKAGFITALYIVLVPVASIFLHKKAGIKVWISVAIAVVGLYFLCMTDSISLSKGDFFVFLCALTFTGHILIVDHFVSKVDGVLMSCIQFLVTGVITTILAFICETPTIGQVQGALVPLLYAGIMSCGAAYTLQILGQKDMNPTVASLILSLESVTSVVAAFIILGQKMSGRELVGCILMFTAIILAQLPDKNS